MVNTMTGDKELLNYIYENVDMGLQALNALEKNLKHTDNKIKSNVTKSLEIYKEYKKKCERMLKKLKVTPTKGNIIASIMTKMGTTTEFMRDNSDSKLADTLIQGYNMGIIDIDKKLNRYKGDISHSVRNLALEYKKMMQTGIKDIKGFL